MLPDCECVVCRAYAGSFYLIIVRLSKQSEYAALRYTEYVRLSFQYYIVRLIEK